MLRKTFFGLTVVASMSLAGASAFAADPTLHQVYQAAEAGNYREAQSMMDKVLHDHPDSAKAHFVEAELLAKEGRLSEAQYELATAQRLAPELSFARPGEVQTLKARLAPAYEVHQFGGTPVGASSTRFPWTPVLLAAGLLALAAVLFRLIRERSAYAAQSARLNAGGGGATVGAAQPYTAGGVGPMAASGGIGSGISGGLATGAAVGAGVVAGEALMHHMLDGHRSDDASASDTLAGGEGDSWERSDPQYDMGGEDFGVSGDSWDDSSAGAGDDWN